MRQLCADIQLSLRGCLATLRTCSTAAGWPPVGSTGDETGSAFAWCGVWLAWFAVGEGPLQVPKRLCGSGCTGRSWRDRTSRAGAAARGIGAPSSRTLSSAVSGAPPPTHGVMSGGVVWASPRCWLGCRRRPGADPGARFSLTGQHRRGGAVGRCLSAQVEGHVLGFGAPQGREDGLQGCAGLLRV